MKFNANFYLQKGQFVKDENENISYKYDEYLYSKGIYKTKIKPENLPEHYLKISMRGNNGFVNTKGVVAMIYKPNMWINHLLRDDKLYVSYKNKIIKDTSSQYEEFEGYDHIIYGYDILYFLQAAEIYSNYNLDEIKEVLEEKRNIFKKKHPNEYKRENPNDLPLMEIIKKT